ncbi:hypothetical protein TTHERM_000418349 (macronuclear) [Tetrahymena thermophila SB210]|uniref:Uncharacterized protein n=1 Tax=Tetrahymena thermophila (strain SB210) TaxID=312017 RepID=W7XFF9_TETTS|nr:hypothetical protein TTHERM_000418349 [Tetrahymena thermophila SB210]EWS76567.1 hypothetical protein TTHERM_000418349 [Tetrahymena thermophila SB210]|eukprot:XP_012650853.1 hypothetical protein TTHERM_000418349 [Tetrahymena thermophila SB210]
MLNQQSTIIHYDDQSYPCPKTFVCGKTLRQNLTFLYQNGYLKKKIFYEFYQVDLKLKKFFQSCNICIQLIKVFINSIIKINQNCIFQLSKKSKKFPLVSTYCYFKLILWILKSKTQRIKQRSPLGNLHKSESYLTSKKNCQKNLMTLLILQKRKFLQQFATFHYLQFKNQGQLQQQVVEYSTKLQVIENIIFLLSKFLTLLRFSIFLSSPYSLNTQNDLYNQPFQEDQKFIISILKIIMIQKFNYYHNKQTIQFMQKYSYKSFLLVSIAKSKIVLIKIQKIINIFILQIKKKQLFYKIQFNHQ